MSEPSINRFECPECGLTFTLVGGDTNYTRVICERCNVWMRIANPHGLPKLLNYPRGDAGDKAFDVDVGMPTRDEFQNCEHECTIMYMECLQIIKDGNCPKRYTSNGNNNIGGKKE